MSDLPVPRGRRPVVALLISIALVATACGDGAETSTPTGNPELSLAPAEHTSTPEVLPNVTTLPSLAPPPDDSPAPPEVDVDYVFGADDLDSFAEAYQSMFGVELDRDAADQIGARVCTYLMRHADGDGVVDVQSAVIEADLNEPGYPRADWMAAFEVANAYYCGEFAVDFAGYGG